MDANVKLFKSSVFRKYYDAYYKSRIVESLRRIAGLTDCNDVILYYRDDEHSVYSANDFENFDIFFSEYYEFDTSLDQIREWLGRSDYPELLPVRTLKKYGSTDKEIVLYVFPILNREPQMTAMFLIDNQWFIQQLSNTFLNYDGEVYLSSSSQRLITYSSPNGVAPFESEAEGEPSAETDGYVYVSATAKVNDFVITARLKEQEMYNSVSGLRFLIFICSISLLTSGIIGAILVAKSNYKPVLGLKSQLGEAETGNDFKIIGRGIEQIKELSEKTQKELEIRERKLKHLILKDIILNEAEQSYENDLFSGTTEDLAPMKQRVLVFDSNQSCKSPEDLAIILNMVAYEESICTYEIKNDSDDTFVALVRYPSIKSGELEQELEWLEERIINKLNKNYEVFCGIETDNVYDIKSSYLSACDLYSKERSQSDMVYPHSDIKKLTAAVEQYRLVDAKKLLEHIKSDLLTLRLQPFIRNCIVFEIYNAFIKLIRENSSDEDTNAWMKKIIDSQEQANDENYIFRCLVEKAESLLENKLSRSNIVESACEYIGENLHDYNLSVGQISDVFGMSASYLNRMFRKDLQMSISEYLTVTRMEKVKYMLKNTDIPIRTIMENVGYCDLSSFGRKFKSLLGVSMTDFRRENRKDGSNDL